MKISDHIDKDVPIIAMGDFTVDVKRNDKEFGFMKEHFDLNMVPTNYPNTLGNSYIDSIFTRNMSPELLNYDDVPMDGWDLIKFPSYTQAADRTVKLVNEASRKRVGPQNRDGFVTAILESIKQMS
ncbi:hypothetical protein AVEN_5832-1 [Araneus ventricosus]|uniref:Uncharacterized protein n=1 Tax=Araneus ventricosus TaxID=182803 RepID=A0A4Y2L3Z7_ARAVE|nr:hypothetical protein AVEN_5832-1 [Araneus ventricosus]